MAFGASPPLAMGEPVAWVRRAAGERTVVEDAQVRPSWLKVCQRLADVEHPRVLLGSTATESAEPPLFATVIVVAVVPSGFVLPEVKGTTMVPPAPSATNRLSASGDRTICLTVALVSC